MKPRLITMLTYNDETVQNALEVFRECADLDCLCWGFKDVGLPPKDMTTLVDAMKDAGKETFLEVVSLSEDECMRGAKLAVECGFDYLMGTIFYQSVLDYLKAQGMKYFPFCGKVVGHPSVVEGTIQDAIDDARKLEALGVDGFDLLAYRFVGDPEELMEQFLREVTVPVVIAGSIDSFARLDKMKELQPWGFTIGTAFFEHQFVEQESFRSQMEAVIQYMQK